MGDGRADDGRTNLHYLARERVASTINGRLRGTGIRVSPRLELRGPYSLLVDRLTRSQLDAVIAAVLEVTGRRADGIGEGGE